MSRAVRRVPPDWEHPMYWTDRIDARTGLVRAERCPRPLHGARRYEDHVRYYQEDPEDYERPPDRADYMPEFPEGTATHYMMYEECSEGTPISPAFATPEELARWLADNNASAFGSMTATYEQWLHVARGGWAPSAVSVGGGPLVSGVAVMGGNP